MRDPSQDWLAPYDFDSITTIVQAIHILTASTIGLGATLLIDLWALVLRRAFGTRSLNYCLLGRWVLHIPTGRIAHESILPAAMPGKPHECKVGWTTHYMIGAAFAVVSREQRVLAVGGAPR